ncbi:MAG: hypothetical protein K1X89_09585 [Myxococcaceae bacterium]|nr:hypothetical protein [Myxococcaceae bacterium]
MTAPSESVAPRPAAPTAPYEPPRIVWTHALEALTQVTQPPCIPGQDPRCTP